jgi:hypothetical protein
MSETTAATPSEAAAATSSQAASATPGETVREAVGVFTAEQGLYDAIDELERNGFTRSDLSLMAPRAFVEQELQHELRTISEVEDDARVPRAAVFKQQTFGELKGVLIAVPVYIGAITAVIIAAALGWETLGIVLAAAIVGALAGGLGFLLSRRFERRRADYLREQLERGGIVLWVRIRTSKLEERATTILRECGATDVHVHTLPVLKQPVSFFRFDPLLERLPSAAE